LDNPLVVIALVGDIVDKMMVDPANDLFGGYYPFIRRMVLPLVLILISIFIYDLSNGNMLVSAIVTGFSIGPVLILERIMIIYLIKQKDTKISS
tara:strand:+ start:1390 stop:1671 length:282 start_codon:yes stop_codon:yes gene_type:complete